MSSHSPYSQTKLGLAVACVTAAAGCIGPGSGVAALLFGNLQPIPIESLFPHWVLGATEQRIIIARMRLPDEFEDATFDFESSLLGPPSLNGVPVDSGTDPDDYPQPTAQLVAVDRSSLETRVLFDGLQADLFGMDSDGRWLVWPDGESGELWLMDLDVDADPRRLDPPLTGQLSVREVVGGRALVMQWADNTRAWLVIDLTTGEEMLREESIQFPVMNRAGELAAFRDIPAEPETAIGDIAAGRYATRNIELIDLASGETSAVISDPSIQDANRLYLTDDTLLWVAHEYDGSASRSALFAYDLGTGVSRMVAELEGVTGSTSTHVGDVGSAGVLLDSSSGFEDFEENPLALLTVKITKSYELMSFDGSRRTVLEVAFGLFDFAAQSSDPVLIDDAAVFAHPSDGDYVVVNLESGVERRFDPFAGLD